MARLVMATILGLMVGGAAGQDLATKAYSYCEGFEGDVPEFKLWAKNGDSTINTLEATEEEAFEGARSLKLDMTLNGGSYHYIGVMKRVPCAGKLTLSARVLVAEGTTARVGFGTNMAYPPTTHTGCGPAETFDGPTGEWKLIEVDLVERGESGAASVLRQHTGNVTGEDVGVYLDRWSLFIMGGEGKRAVVYLDDVKIEGEIPSEADYEAVIDGRWEAAQERFATQVAAWREGIAKGEAVLAEVDAQGMEERVATARARAAEATKLIDGLEKKGYGHPNDTQAIESAMFALKHEPATIRAIAEARAAGMPFLLYAPAAMTNDRLVSGEPIPAALAEELSCGACRGEYESVSLAVYAVDAVEGLLLSATELTGENGSIPADAVDIHVVKVWYQAGRGIRDLKGRILVPELLVKDDALVQVDTEEQHNYLRSTAADGTEEYLLCSDAESMFLGGVRPIDAEELQPVDIAADTLKQFWVTVKVPDECGPGEYSGDIVLTTAAGERKMPLKVTVHPFELKPPRLIYSVYYRAKLSDDGEPTITSELRSEEQYRAEIADMLAHGVAYPTNYQGWTEPLIQRVMEIREEVGMPGGPFFNLGRGTGATSDVAKLADLQADIKKWVELCDEYGYDEIYFYGIDEAKGERLKSQRDTWAAVREAGGKTFVACYLKTYEAMGDLLDCAVLAGPPNPEEGEKYHSVGSLVFCYANPQVGPEEAETFRRNFGLVLWKAGFDGAMDYAYQHGFGHVWNDFDSTSYRDHNFTYPTVNGVVDTVQWEGFREGVDDVRYVTTLEEAIAEAQAGKKTTADEAQAWLDALEPKTADLDEVRGQVVEWVGRLE